MTDPVELGSGRLLVDLDFRDLHGLIGSYLLPEPEGWALIEVGPSTCHEGMLRGLRAAGVGPEDVRDVFVTHIHLDHAGGAGRLAQDLPKATFHVHEAGLPHLLAPAKLQASALRAWGPVADELWGPILPLPPDRVHPLKGGEVIDLAHGSKLRVLATPGHARHHLSFFDTATGGVFTGDGAGVLIPGARHIRPAVPPPDLDVPQLLSSLDAMAAVDPKVLFFSHYGRAEKARERLAEARSAVERWTSIALVTARTTPTVEAIAAALRDDEATRSRSEGEDPNLRDRSGAISGLELAAQGLLRYLTRTGQIPSGPA